MTGTTTAKREYKLAADPIVRAGKVTMREILEMTDGGACLVAAFVPDSCAMDVRDALARAYQDGREDRAANIEIARNDVITIVPEAGPQRRMLVSHVEHHIITLTDLP